MQIISTGGTSSELFGVKKKNQDLRQKPRRHKPSSTRLEREANPQPELREIRKAVADYMQSEGCSCCRDNDAHKLNEARLGKLLRVPMYSDKSGYNFSRFKTKP